MSAFICNKKVFSNVYTGLRVFNSASFENSRVVITELLTAVAIEAGGQDLYAKSIEILYALNVEAVNQRYGEVHEPALAPEVLLAMCAFQGKVSSYQLLKSIECLQYQMSEGRVPQSEVYRLLGKLIDALYKDIIHSSDMYKEAVWG